MQYTALWGGARMRISSAAASGLANDLCSAARTGDDAAVRRLLAAGAPVDSTGSDGWTPLHMEACFNHADVAQQLLLDAGADRDARESHGWTPLHMAACFNHAAVASVLLRAEASHATRDNNGCTALHHAARQGHAAVVKLLLGAGAADSANNAGVTALCMAAQDGHTAVVRLLALLHGTAALASTACDPEIKPKGAAIIMRALADRNQFEAAVALMQMGSQQAAAVATQLQALPLTELDSARTELADLRAQHTAMQPLAPQAAAAASTVSPEAQPDSISLQPSPAPVCTHLPAASSGLVQAAMAALALALFAAWLLSTHGL